MKLLYELIEHRFEENIVNEKLISLKESKILRIDETRKQIANNSDYYCFVRESVFQKIEMAAKSLPKGFHFLIKEAYRPMEIQNNSFNYVFNEYKKLNPGLNHKELFNLVSTYVAPTQVAGHPTGGAIDLTLLEGDKEVYMGTEYNEEPNETDNRTYLHSEKISDSEKKYREILSSTLINNGFVNYPPEWWHWSYGDKYWAFMTKKPVLYDPVAELTIQDEEKNIRS